MDPSQQQIVQELSALSTSDRTDRTATLNGTGLQMRYSPAPGVDMRIEASDPEEPGAVAVSTVFDGGTARPPSYPPELPYLPGLKASITAVPGRGSAPVAWLMVPDVEGAVAQILAQSTAAGWSESAEADDELPPGLRTIELIRPGLRRSVIVTSFGDISSIVLADESADEQDGRRRRSGESPGSASRAGASC